MAVFFFATQKGYVVKENKIKRSKPVLDGLLDHAKAEQIMLAVEIAKKALENDKTIETGGNEDINELDKKKNANTPKKDPEVENEEEVELNENE